jgi:ElaB/YqjD/DUF883 family membrane-anchored ribosome-binding protein
MTDDINKEINQVKADIASLREDVSVLLQAIRQSGTEEGERLYQRASARAQEAGATARQHTQNAYNAFEREVEQRPLAAMATALATGFVVGLLLDRRH